MKLYTFVEREKEYEKVMEESSEKALSMKSAEEQYKEKAKQILNCTELTNSVSIEYLELKESGEGTRCVRGHATRKRDGWFRVDLVSTDMEMKVREEDLLDATGFRIRENKVAVSSKQQEVICRRAKRESKKREIERTNKMKQEAVEAQQAMLEREMDKIEECVQQGFFGRNLLLSLIKSATSPFTYEKDGYKTVTIGNNATCASILSLTAVDGILTDKRKADELSRIDAERRKRNGKKMKRTPNTTRSATGIDIIQHLDKHDNIQASENTEETKKKMEKEIKSMTDTLTDWDKCTKKKEQAAATAAISIDDPQLWDIYGEGKHTAAERKCFLKLCVENSGVLGKNERVQLTCLQENDVTRLLLLAAVETMKTKLTALKKEYDDKFSRPDTLVDRQLSVEESANDDDVSLEDEMIEMIIDESL